MGKGISSPLIKATPVLAAATVGSAGKVKKFIIFLLVKRSEDVMLSGMGRRPPSQIVRDTSELIGERPIKF